MRHRNFEIIYEQSTTGWGAYVPSLPGLGVAAKTRRQAETLIRKAMPFHLKGMRLAKNQEPKAKSR